jgi:hypothetical protein
MVPSAVRARSAFFACRGARRDPRGKFAIWGAPGAGQGHHGVAFAIAVAIAANTVPNEIKRRGVGTKTPSALERQRSPKIAESEHPEAQDCTVACAR